MKIRFFSLLFTIALCPWSSFAYDEDEVDYDGLVKQLTYENETIEGDLLSEVEIHFGAAFSSSLFTVTPKNSPTIYASQRAVQASVGIDLFSKYWMAEGAFLNFIEREYDAYQIRLKEFDLKVIHKNRLDSSFGYRIGLGLASRYLTIKTGETEESYTTPFSIVSGGLEAYVSRKFSMGVEVATRNTMTYETPDQSAVDLTLRLDGHF